MINSERFLISIIIPVYNTSIYLNRCLDSIICQSLQNFEVIIINDGSTDDSLEICEKYQKSDPRIKIISQPNEGISNALNNGISLATGDWLCFVDSDDWIDSNALKVLADKIHKHPNVELIRSFCRFVYGTEVREQNLKNQQERIYNRIDFIASDKIGGFTHSLFVKRSIVFENQLKFDTELKIKADMVFNWKCVLNCNCILLSDFVYYNYLIRPDSIIQTIDKTKILDNLKAPEIIENYAKNYSETEIKEAVKRYLVRGLESFILSYLDYLRKGNKSDLNYRRTVIKYILNYKICMNDFSVRLIVFLIFTLIEIRILMIAKVLLKK